jgi:hypothetical protein
VVNTGFPKGGGDLRQKPLFEADPIWYKLIFSSVSSEKDRKQFLEGKSDRPVLPSLKSATSALVSFYNKYAIAALGGQISNYSFH